MARVRGNWSSLFTPTILSRGRSYFSLGKAKKLATEDYGYSVTVRGSKNYRVEFDLDFDGDIEYISCTCPYAMQGEYCKHMAAALFYLEKCLGHEVIYVGDDMPEDDSLTEKKKDQDRQTGVKSSEKEKAGQTGIKSSEKEKAGQTGVKSSEKGKAGQTGVKSSEKGKEKSEQTGVRSSAKEQVPSQKSGSTFGSRPVADEFEDLAALQKNELAVRTSEESSYAFVPSDYHYFNGDKFLDDMKTTQSSRKKAKAYLKKTDNPDLRVSLGYREGTSSEELVGHASLSEQTPSRYPSWEVRLTFNRDRIISSTCSGWNCSYARYYGSDQYACEHQIAAIYLLQDYLKRHNPGDSTNLSGMYFLMGLTGETVNQDVTPSLTIVPYLTRDEDGLYANFRVGAGKLYKIKNLPEFTKAMQTGSQMTFGTKTTLTLGKEYILPESVKWMNFIERFLQDEEVQIRKYTNRLRYGNYYSNEIAASKDKVDLSGQVLDSFFDVGEGGTFEFTDKTVAAKKKSFIEFKKKDISVTLKISSSRNTKGELEGILITGDVPEMITGLRRKYFVTEKELNCIPEERTTALKSVLEAEHGGYIRIMIGRNHLADFYHKILPSLKEIVNIECTPETEAEIETILPPEPDYVTYFDVDAGNIIGRSDVYYNSNCSSLTDLIERKPVESYRNIVDEEGMLDLLMQYFTSYDPVYKILFAKKDSDLVFDLLDRGIPAIMQKSEVRMTERFKALKIRKRSKFDIGLSVESNLLDLSVSSSDLSPDELLDILFSYRKKKRYITLKNGDFFKIDENESVMQLAEMMEGLHLSPKDFVSGKMHIPAYRALYLDKMLESSQDIYATRDSRFKSLIKEFKTIEDADYAVPSTLRNTLRKYQTVGYRWLRTLDSHHFGGVLADDMGLGKTLQVISVLLAVKNENPDEHFTSLIVTPASLVYNWKEEIRTFAESLTVSTITGTQKERSALIGNWKDSDVLVTSYDLLKRDISEYEGKKFRFVVADEAQYIKNRNTAAAKSLKLVEAETRYALTGTPIENRLGELWSIFDYLMPGLLYTYEEFRSGFEAPIMKSESEEAMEQLRKMVTPFILRRKKTDVLKDLPDKLEEVRYAHMESKQQKLYDGQVVRMRKKLQSADEADFRKGKIEILAELMHIRQICCDPSLMFEDYSGSSAKRELCLELIDSLIDGGHRALLFSQFTTMLEKIEEDLKERGIEYYKITGATPKEKRLKLVKSFNEGDVPIFLISLKAGGTGLNLTGADVVIHYDPWWNTAVQDQATDRAHRIGQTKVVNVYKLIVKGTIEEKIVEMQNAKRKLADDILQAEGVASAAISREELLELLS